MKVGTRANEEEDDEQEGLELEDAELEYVLSLQSMLWCGRSAIPLLRSDAEPEEGTLTILSYSSNSMLFECI